MTDKLREALEQLAQRGTHHDPIPTRRLTNPATDPLAFEVDCWWQAYFQSADDQVRKIARAALAAPVAAPPEPPMVGADEYAYAVNGWERCKAECDQLRHALAEERERWSGAAIKTAGAEAAP